MTVPTSQPAGAVRDTIRVLIVDDDEQLSEGLGLLIDATPGYRCAGRCGSVEAALRTMAAAHPHVVLLDIGLPGMPGSEGVRLLRERHPDVEVVMLTVYAERDKIFESICNGASGYLLKNTPPARLLEGIGEVVAGGAPISPEIARKVIRLFQGTHQPAEAQHRVTAQEVRLLALLAEGYSYQAAAGQLGISVNTVRNYIRSIYDKLHVHSKSEAVSKALRRGLIDLS